MPNHKFKHIYIETTHSPLVYDIHAQGTNIFIGTVSHLYGGEFIFLPQCGINFDQDSLAEILASLEVANNRVSIKPEVQEPDNGYEF